MSVSKGTKVNLALRRDIEEFGKFPARKIRPGEMCGGIALVRCGGIGLLEEVRKLHWVPNVCQHFLMVKGQWILWYPRAPYRDMYRDVKVETLLFYWCDLLNAGGGPNVGVTS